LENSIIIFSHYENSYYILLCKNLLMNKEYKNRFQKLSFSEPKQKIITNLSLKDLYN
jgi:hypothetical protein